MKGLGLFLLTGMLVAVPFTAYAKSYSAEGSYVNVSMPEKYDDQDLSSVANALRAWSYSNNEEYQDINVSFVGKCKNGDTAVHFVQNSNVYDVFVNSAGGVSEQLILQLGAVPETWQTEFLSDGLRAWAINNDKVPVTLEGYNYTPERTTCTVSAGGREIELNVVTQATGVVNEVVVSNWFAGSLTTADDATMNGYTQFAKRLTENGDVEGMISTVSCVVGENNSVDMEMEGDNRHMSYQLGNYGHTYVSWPKNYSSMEEALAAALQQMAETQDFSVNGKMPGRF